MEVGSRKKTFFGDELPTQKIYTIAKIKWNLAFWADACASSGNVLAPNALNMASGDICLCVDIRRYAQNWSKIHMKMRWNDDGDDVGELCNGAENQILHLALLFSACMYSGLMFGQTMGNIYAFVCQFIFVHRRNEKVPATNYRLQLFGNLINFLLYLLNVCSMYQTKFLVSPQCSKSNG